MELTPEDLDRLEEIERRPPLKHPYEIDGFRALFGSKRTASAERKRMAKARDAWQALDPHTKEWLRGMAAERVLEMLAASSNGRVADAVEGSSEDELARLRAEIAGGHVFERTGDGFEVPDAFVLGEGASPIDPPALLEACEEAMTLPPHGLEEVPNLRAVVRELYAIWRRDKPTWRRDQPGTPKVSKEAVTAIGAEIARRYGLPLEEAQRRVRVNLRELDARNDLPLR